jgi:cytochrome c-type biogenesis protein CcmH
MIDFWLAAGLLLLVALAFLLIPAIRGRRAQAEEDRTALNVALYEERQAELVAQHAAGTLSDEQLDAGRAEAGRELLADAEGSDRVRSARLGRTVPLVMALLMPLLGGALYLYWGASDKVGLAREFAQPPRSIEEMTTRLELAVKAQPDSAEGWYFLGRSYMAQSRPEDAAKAFSRSVELAGRQPELLGQWAQALYFAGGKQWNASIQSLADEALKNDPDEVTSLGLLGISAFEGKRFQDAINYWERLVEVLPAQDPSREALRGGIQRAREQLAEQPQEEAPAVAESGVALKIRVQLSAELKAKVEPGDAVFVFARALSGPPMPLAAKRLSVADLPSEITLRDADAMMPQLQLSKFPKVELVARISRAGNATRGEWIGRSAALDTSTTDLQQLTVDSPDSP